MNETIKKILVYCDWAGAVISWFANSLRNFPKLEKDARTGTRGDAGQ